MKTIIPLATISLFLTACGGGTASYQPPTDSIDQDLEQIMHTKQLTGNLLSNLPADKAIPSITSRKSQLGMKLFYSKALGGKLDTACVTCHHPVRRR